MTVRGSEIGQEFRDIRCSHSKSLPALLGQLRLSVLISTYQTGHLVVVAVQQDRLVLTFHQFERAMGIAVKIAVNMVLKVKQTHIQDGCAISSGATVMSGVVIERDTTVLPLSLVLKDMNLVSATYQGSPVEPVMPRAHL